MEFNAKNNADKNVAATEEQNSRQMTTMSIDELDMIYGGVYNHKLSKTRSSYQAATGNSL